MKVGTLVTALHSMPLVLPWVGCVVEVINGPAYPTTAYRLQYLDHRPQTTVWDKQRFRSITDDEALAVAAWLVTGDPAAEWEECDEGAYVLVHDDDVDTALWSCPEGDWAVFCAPGQEDSVAHGHAPTNRARRVAASQAFITHLCGGAHD